MNRLKFLPCLIAPLAGISASAATVSALFDTTMDNPLLFSKWQTSWVRTPAFFSDDLFFGYGSPATVVYKWNGGDIEGYSVGGSFSHFSVDGGNVVAAVNASGTHQITVTNEGGTSVVLADASTLGKSTGLASTHFAQGANGKIAFNLQQGPTSGVDYGAIVYYDGSNFSYIAETGDSVPGSAQQFGVLTGYSLSISQDGSKVAFNYESSFGGLFEGLYEWDGSSLNLIYDSASAHGDGKTYFHYSSFYLNNQLHFVANTNDGGMGIFRVEANGDFTKLLDGNVAIAGTGYYFDRQAIGANGEIAFIGKKDNPDAFNTYLFAGFTLSSGGSPEMNWESADFDFTTENLSQLALTGFDGESMSMTIYTQTFKGIFASNFESGGDSEFGFWGPYEIFDEVGHVDTGDFLHWIQVYQNSGWVYSFSLESWIYFPTPPASLDAGSWVYFSN